MPVHDWTRVEACIYHDFHVSWLPEISKAFNGGLLPDGFYALVEAHAGRCLADVLTLHESSPPPERMPLPPDTGGVAVAEAPPRVRRKQTLDQTALSRRRSLAIRHVSGHRLIAILEIISPANKDRARHVQEFVEKAAGALEVGIHLLLVDLFPPGPHDRHGVHDAIVQSLQPTDEPYDLPANEPLTIASYAAGPPVEAYLEHMAIGTALPDMPLFLRSDRYVNVPLESTYQSAYQGLPAFWKAKLEGC